MKKYDIELYNEIYKGLEEIYQESLRMQGVWSSTSDQHAHKHYQDKTTFMIMALDKFDEFARSGNEDTEYILIHFLTTLIIMINQDDMKYRIGYVEAVRDIEDLFERVS